MTDNEAYAAIGERAEELTKVPEIQKKMLALAKSEGKEKAESWLYQMAVASLWEDVWNYGKMVDEANASVGI